jgi:long-chain fatty acid transport protein
VKREGASAAKMDTTDVVVPNGYFTKQFMGGKIGFGLGVVSPYGLQTSWGDTSSVRYVATTSDIRMMDVTPAVSYRPSERFAVGAGVDYFSTYKATLQKKVSVDAVNVGLGGSPAGLPDGNSKMDGDGDGWGYHAGVLVSPTPKHHVGVTFHSEVKTKIEGQVELTGLSGASAGPNGFGGTNFKTKARTDLFYPANVQIGYRFDPNVKWSFFANAAWFHWAANKQLTIVLPDATATQQAIAGKPVPLDWKDGWSVSVAGKYKLNERWALNGGLCYEPAVYPEQTFSPSIPDMDRFGISVGPNYRNGNWGVDAVYNPIFMRRTTINNKIGQANAGPAGDISGTYKGQVHIVSVSARYFF